MSNNDNKMVVIEAVSNFRLMVQQLIALHQKRQRDHIVRLRQHFFTKLSRRLHRNFMIYRRKRQQLEEDVVALTPARAPRQRRHSYDRSLLNSFCDQLGSTPFDIEQINMFRMDAGTFSVVCDMVKEELLPGRAPQNIDAPLTLEMKVAIALYVLGSGADYRMVGKRFEVHFTTVRKCVQTFCEALVKASLESEIRMPTTADGLETVSKDFEDFVGIPQCMGIIDCLHVAVNLPSSEPTQYINSKGWGSLVLQAVVDRQGRFINISCNHPGKANDESVLLQSSIYPIMEHGVHPFDQTRSIDGKEVHPFLLGDKGYPLLPWLITPYSPSKLSSAEYSFNVYVAKARNVIGATFERLTGRWKVLDRCLYTNIDVVPDIIATCCILHNITERFRSPYRESWSDCPSVEDATPTQPRWACGIVTAEGEELRNHLAKYMVNNFPNFDDDDD
uniref:DDE Tnp4 domain-containing protein n=1 Tax=Anopheles atroparvus TaxID=41427 RepID=A0A182JBQ5_ANOAO